MGTSKMLTRRVDDHPPAIAPMMRSGSTPEATESGSGSVRRLVRKIFLAREEAQKRPPLLRDLIPNRPAQHGITGLQRVEHRALRDRPLDLNCTSPPTCASVRRCCGSMTRITAASAPQPKARPANPAQSEPSYLQHPPMHKPARRSCQNKFRIYPVNPQPWHRATR